MMEVPYHYQFRVIVIGDTMVGKSSLLKTFSEGTFGEIEPTVGVDFFSRMIQIRPHDRTINEFHGASKQPEHSSKDRNILQRSTGKCSSNNNSSPSQHTHATSCDRTIKTDDSIIVKLQIWDTAGQERFKSIVTSYYRNAVGIVLVYDITNRESYENLISWFEEASHHVEPKISPPLSPIATRSTRKVEQHAYSPNFGRNMGPKDPVTSTPNAESHANYARKSASENSNNTHTNKRPYPYNQQVGHLNSSSSSTSEYTFIRDDIDASDNYHSHEKTQDDYKMAYLVIGCKTDLESQRQVSYEDGKAFADTYGFKFIETSSKRYHNVDKAFQMLAEEIYHKITQCGRLKMLRRSPSGSHLTFDETYTNIDKGIRIGPLIESELRYYDRDSVRLPEARPVEVFLGGCC